MDEASVLVGVATGLVAVLMSFGIVFWWIYWSYRKKQLQYHERQLMIEKGMVPPPVLPEERMTPEDALRRGTVNVCLGIGLGLAGLIAANSIDEDLGGLAAVAAVIVGFVGVGNLVYYLIARRRAALDHTS